ncbi:MAG: hypothetical protein LBM77_11995 [Spirochaetaceae bacterium]|nr:hypothetical protein [Spirochaetaceae bacterium]
MPLLLKLEWHIHSLFCTNCARELYVEESLKELSFSDMFFSETPLESNLEDIIMAKVSLEPYMNEASHEISYRRWIVSGLVVLFSFALGIYGLGLHSTPVFEETTYLMATGITIGIIISVYAALFIGSHVKELSERFHLHPTG